MRDGNWASQHASNILEGGIRCAIPPYGPNKRRQDALAGTEPQTGSDRGEYPPAVTAEGGSGASVRPIDPSDNRGAGASFGNQIKGLLDGSQIQVIVGPKPLAFESPK
jgi:hypothetical protein